MTSTSTTSSAHRDGYVPFPAQTAEAYRAAGYWAGRPLGDLLRDSARQHPHRPVLLDGERNRTYGLATYKLPDVFRRSDKLPITAVGKVDKKMLRAEG
ncbi:hypothetical protein [Nocardia sp. NBC_00881]|uniref:hypothetical protein n=1 Tax=Nocardia sp. NBC_00881 TaxID=2975995 RepID=UPI00386AE5AE